MVELVGPENNRQLSLIISHIRDNFIGTVVVDGALNRITQISCAENALFFYILRVNQKNLSSSVNTLKRFHIFDSLPVYNAEHDNMVFWKGAMTDRKLVGRDKDERYVIDDFTKIFLSDRKLEKMTDSDRLYIRNPFNLYRFVINLEGVKEDEFNKKTGEVKHKLMYNPYCKGMYDNGM
jgi:hypothetical protein